MPSQVKRQKSYPYCGRLIVLQSLSNRNILDTINSSENFKGFTAINFPAMPDSIDLERRADYMVSTPIGFPDGIHMYKGTSVLEIPLSFKLHAFDKEYCPQGAKTLLQIAADLESLVLPFGASKALVTYGTEAEKGEVKAGEDAAVKQTAAEPTKASYTPPQNIFPPATCYLELIVTERNSVGIACVGYVKQVRVKLSGPYMKGPGISQNLPSHGDFEFVFVHHPGHGNAWSANAVQSSISEQQAYAGIVQTNLFNTIQLMTNANNFHSFND